MKLHLARPAAFYSPQHSFKNRWPDLTNWKLSATDRRLGNLPKKRSSLGQQREQRNTGQTHRRSLVLDRETGRPRDRQTKRQTYTEGPCGKKLAQRVEFHDINATSTDIYGYARGCEPDIIIPGIIQPNT